MIPLRDDAPRFSTPYVTYFLIALNSMVFLMELALPRTERDALFYRLGAVPQHLVAWLAGSGHVGHTNAVQALLPLFTSMFLHASWLHLIANMWVLWIFGDNVEDYLGHLPYLLFYLVTGVAAGIAQVLLNWGSPVPTVGASGAIAGVMGAFLLLYPRAKVLTIVPLIIIFTFWWIPAWIVLGYWFLAQFLGGAVTEISTAHAASGGVAFWAHVGGFLAGMLLIKLIPQRVQRYRYGAW